MTTIFPTGIFLESHGSKLNYVTQYSSVYGYLWGYLGNTQCCGSACVLISELSCSSFFHILRETKASVLHIVESCPWISHKLSHYKKEINDKLGDAAHIEIFPQTNGWLVLVHIDDEDLYLENFI